MFDKIVAFYDLSDPSRNALSWALGWAEHSYSDLKIVHVLQELPAPFLPAESFPSERILQEVRAQIDRDLRSSAGAEGFKRLRSLDIEVILGEPVLGCLKTIHQESPDLAVVGTHGRTGLSHVFLGSVAEKIIRHSPCPVWVARGGRRWPLKKLLLPIDPVYGPAEATPEDPSEEALALAGEFAQMLGLQIDLLHVLPPPALLTAPGAHPHLGLLDFQEPKRWAKEELEKLRGRHPSLPITPHLEEGPAAHRICEMAKSLSSDFILIPTHGRSGMARFFLGSVAEHVVRYAPCPVLTFCPEKAVRIRREFLDHFTPEKD